MLLKTVKATWWSGLLQPQQSSRGRQPGPHGWEGQAQTLSQAWPQSFLLDLPFHDLSDDAVEDVGDAIILWGGLSAQDPYKPVGEVGPTTSPTSAPLGPHSHWAGLE